MHCKHLLTLLSLALFPLLAVAQTAPLIGQVMLWSGSRAPTGWAPCNGQLVPINQYQALFSIIGTTYGGDGRTTFALPNLINRIPVSFGEGSGMSTIPGDMAGPVIGGTVPVQGTASGRVALTPDNIPAHSHSATFVGIPANVQVDSTMSVITSPGQLLPQAGGFLSQGAGAGVGQAAIFAPSSSTGNMVNLGGVSGSANISPAGSVDVGATGDGQPLGINLPIRAQVALPPPPILAMQYVIAVQGVFPSFS